MTIKIAENLQLLRKNKKMTQEELAVEFGVTSQSISKWELGLSCPDITLLPKIADYFKVSVDELLGTKPISSINSIYIQMKNLVNEQKTDEEKHDLIYRLVILASMCDSKQEQVMIEKVLQGKQYTNVSLSQNKNGLTIKGCNSLFISSFNDFPECNFNTIRKIHKYLTSINKINTLKVIAGLFNLTIREKGSRNSFTIQEISQQTNLDENDIWKAFNDINIQIQRNSDTEDTWYLPYLNEIPMFITLLIPALTDWNPGEKI